MTKIDWCREFICGWEYIERLTDKSHGEYNLLCRQTVPGNRPAIFDTFNEDGVSRCGLQLENIPQEPEREEGWYEAYWQGGIVSLAYWDGYSWYQDERGIPGDNIDPPDRVIARVYLSGEYRPADKCPPPMDGTPFEVEGEESGYRVFMQTDGDYLAIPDNNHYSRWGLSILLGKRWRPVQT